MIFLWLLLSVTGNLYVEGSQNNPDHSHLIFTMKKFILVSIASLSPLSSLALPVNAAPPGWSDFKDAQGSVYIGATAPNADIKLELSGVDIKKSVRLNACGMGKISNTESSPVPTTINIQGSAVTVASLTQRIFPKCVVVNGSYQPEEARTENFKTVDGSLIIVGTPNMVVDYTASGLTTKNIKANQCGWAKITNSPTNPIPANATIRATVGAVGFATATDYGTIPQETAWKCDGNVAFKPVQ